MIKSSYEWKILKWDVRLETNKHTKRNKIILYNSLHINSFKHVIFPSKYSLLTITLWSSPMLLTSLGTMPIRSVTHIVFSTVTTVAATVTAVVVLFTYWNYQEDGVQNIASFENIVMYILNLWCMCILFKFLVMFRKLSFLIENTIASYYLRRNYC